MGFSLKSVGQMFTGTGAKGGPPNPFSLSYKDLDFLKDPANAQFGDWINNINAPSSVDAVRGEVDSSRLQSLMQGIDQDTERSVGGIKLDAQERGIGGAGQASDVEFNALGTARNGGVRAKSDARLAGMMGELDRLKAKEAAASGAYGTRYGAGVQGQNSLAQLMASLYSGGASRELAGRTAAQPGIFEDILRKAGSKIGEEGGEFGLAKMMGLPLS